MTLSLSVENQSNIQMPRQHTDYLIGNNLLANLDKIKKIKKGNFSSFLLMSDTTVFKLFGGKIVTSLSKLGKPVVTSLVKPGENQKNMSEILSIMKPFFKSGFDRNAVLVAVGGGVITDLGGFISAILLRGIKSIFIPTTLVGQIDAAIGGKNGVDYRKSKDLIFKNMIGTIVQPELVISDVSSLSSLPPKEVLNGLGEMAKYRVGWGKPKIKHLLYFKNPLTSTPGVERGVERDELVNIITICQKIKIDLVNQDPYEKLGLRHKLNLGHTIGHAIEGASGGKLSHGQAVAIGLIAAARISLLKGLLREESFQEIVSLVKLLGLPIRIRNIDKNKVVQALKLDKKAGVFVLIRDIGNLVTEVRVEDELINKVLNELIL